LKAAIASPLRNCLRPDNVQPGRQWEVIENKQVIVEAMARNCVTAATLWFGRHGRRSNRLRDQGRYVTREVATR